MVLTGLALIWPALSLAEDAASVPAGAVQGVTESAPATTGDIATRAATEALSAPVLAQPIRPPRRVPERPAQLPTARWDHVNGAQRWTRSALWALQTHGRALVEITPRDIGDWCPAYPQASPAQRRAFWVGFLSALVKHESTYRPYAVGGGGLWYGLTQILPATARGYNCKARSGEALKNGPANLSCAIRIMARTVIRDGVVSRGRKGVAADWGPLVSSRKRGDMMAWTKQQDYCRAMSSTRPKARPEGLGALPRLTPRLAAIRPKARP